MANKKIVFELDVDGKPIDVIIDKTLNLKQQFRELTKEINKTQEGTKEFELLSSKLGDVKDKMETTTAKSRDLFGSLSLLPGPVGDFANMADNAIGTLKTFTSFSFKDLKFQLGETLNDFKDIASNIGKATGITKIYTTLNNALSKSFVAVGVGETAAAAGAKAFAAALTATGIGALIVLLGSAATALYQMATGEDAAAEASARLNRELESQNTLLDLDQKAAKRRNAETIANMKATGKTQKEIRDAINKQNYEDYQLAFRGEEEARKIYNANLGKANAEDLKKLEDNLSKKEEARKDAYSKYIVDGRNGQAEELKEQQQANQKSIEANKAKLEKIKADNKTADDTLRDLKRENAALAIQDERKRQDKELENQKLSEEDKINALLISEEKKKILIGQIETKYAAKQTDVNKKRKEEDDKKKEEELKATEDFNRKVAEIRIGAIKDETDRAISEREQKYQNDLADLEKDKEFIKKSEKEKADIRKNLRTAADNDVNKIKLDNQIKGFQDELTLLEAQQKTLQEGTQAYTDNAIAIENQAYKIKLANAQNNAKLIEAIETEHGQNIKNIKLAAFIAEKQIDIERLQSIANIGSSLQQLAGKRKGLAIGGIVIEKAAAIGQIWANNAIANAKAISVSPLTFGQPWVTVNTVSAALSTAATVAAAAKAIGEINGQSEGGGTTAAPSQNLGRNYGDGGYIDGPRHAAGGVMINAEGGEAVMTRGAVTMFAPLLSTLNQMGGGTSFSRGASGQASYDAPTSNGSTQQPMIMKTYVVSNELTTESEKMARLKDLSTL